LTEYLRKELKIPEYSELYDDREQLRYETEEIFREKEGLKEKLE
jgi:hypothetical protein